MSEQRADDLRDDELEEQVDDEVEEVPAPREPERPPQASHPTDRAPGKRRSVPPEPPGFTVPLIRGEVFFGPFLRKDKAGVPLLDVFLLKVGQGSDGRPCVRPVPHARVRATYDAFDLLELGNGEAFPRARYRVMIKRSDGVVMGQEDVDLGGEDEPAAEDAGFMLLGRQPAPPTPVAKPAPEAEAARRDGRVAEAIERVDAQHRAHIDDLKATMTARAAEMVELHQAKVSALEERHREQVETLREQLDDLRRDHKGTERELWETRTALHQAQIEAAGLKTRLEIGASAQGPQAGVDVLGVVRAFKVQQQGMRELEAMLAGPKAAEAEESPQPDFGKAMQLFDKIKREVGPVSQIVGLLDDD